MYKSKADGADRESLNTPDLYEVLRNQDRAPAETSVLYEFDSLETLQSVNQGGVVQYSGSEDRVTDTPMTTFSRRFGNINPGFFLSNEDVEKQLSSPSDHDVEILQPVDQCNSGLDPNSNRQFYSVASGSKDLSHGGPSNPVYQRNVGIHPGLYLMHGGSRMARQDLRSNRMGARLQPSLESQQGPIYVGGDGEWTLLHDALTGNKEDIRILLRERKDIKKLLGRSSKGEYLSQQEMETLLRRVEFDVNAQNNKGETMLHLLGNEGDVNIISPLLQLSEADISIKDNEGRTPLLSAIHLPQKMRALLEGRRVDVNAQDDGGKTLLHHAAYSQSSSVITILLKKGADVNARDNEGRTPLHLAIEKYNINDHGKGNPFNVLLEADGIDVNIQDNEGRTALHDIILTGTICNEPMFEALLGADGIDVNIQDNERKTPLHLLANKKTNGMELQSLVAMVEELLGKNGIEVNARDDAGRTPLYYAVFQCSLKLIKLLVENGANVGALDQEGRSFSCVIDDLTRELNAKKKIEGSGATLGLLKIVGEWYNQMNIGASGSASQVDNQPDSRMSDVNTENFRVGRGSSVGWRPF